MRVSTNTICHNYHKGPSSTRMSTLLLALAWRPGSEKGVSKLAGSKTSIGTSSSVREYLWKAMEGQWKASEGR